MPMTRFHPSLLWIGLLLLLLPLLLGSAVDPSQPPGAGERSLSNEVRAAEL